MLPADPVAAQEAIKGRLIEILTPIPDAGKVWNRIRFTDSLAEWIEVGAIVLNEDTPEEKQVVRCIFVYVAGFDSGPTDGKCNTLVRVTYAFEILHQYIDGTTEANSTRTFEAFLMRLIARFGRDLTLGFNEPGEDVSHSYLRGAGSDSARPAIVDGVLCHRIVPTLEVKFVI